MKVFNGKSKALKVTIAMNIKKNEKRAKVSIKSASRGPK